MPIALAQEVTLECDTTASRTTRVEVDSRLSTIEVGGYLRVVRRARGEGREVRAERRRKAAQQFRGRAHRRAQLHLLPDTRARGQGYLGLLSETRYYAFSFYRPRD